VADPWQQLPFNEAIRFFRSKVPIPTESWSDLWEGQHTRAFTVAGAMKASLLLDLQSAVDRAIADGVSLGQFRKDFDEIVARQGWAYKGGREWRTNIIYQTNLSTAYAAGRYAQMTDPDTLQNRPYWLYKHGDSRYPRPQHLAWNGLVLTADDPWWSQHYPPNGWLCSCRVFTLSKADLQRMGKDGPDPSPPVKTREVPDPANPNRTIEVPKGIDPGWAYNVGESAFGPALTSNLTADQARDKLTALNSRLASEQNSLRQLFQNTEQRMQAAFERKRPEAGNRLAKTAENLYQVIKATEKRASDNIEKLLFVENPSRLQLKFDQKILPKNIPDLQKEADFFRNILALKSLNDKNISITIASKEIRPGRITSYYYQGQVFMSPKAPPGDLVHELAHWLEENDPQVHKKALEFRALRTKAEQPIPLGPPFNSDEFTLADHFQIPYAGRVYPNDTATEIISVGLQLLYQSPLKFINDDPHYFDFLFNLVRGHP